MVVSPKHFRKRTPKGAQIRAVQSLKGTRRLENQRNTDIRKQLHVLNTNNEMKELATTDVQVEGKLNTNAGSQM
jgi:hypothetical protein